MRVDEWEFADLTHPVYEREPKEEKNWPVPLPGMVADDYRDREGLTVEPLHMSMEGYPSTDLYKGASGDTVQLVHLKTKQDMLDVDQTEIDQIAEEWLKHLRTMSLGPYSLKLLREMGHPYGSGSGGNARPGNACNDHGRRPLWEGNAIGASGRRFRTGPSSTCSPGICTGPGADRSSSGTAG